MAQITKTVIFPCSTEWLGQDQSSTTVGIATYEGPEQLVTEWEVGAVPAQCERILDPDSKDAEMPTAANCVRVILDASKYPLHALALWGQKYKGARIIVDAGPADVDNPSIADPHDFQETFDQRSFYYDTGTSTWSGGAFNHDGDPTGISTEGVNFGWVGLGCTEADYSKVNTSAHSATSTRCTDCRTTQNSMFFVRC